MALVQRGSPQECQHIHDLATCTSVLRGQDVCAVAFTGTAVNKAPPSRGGNNAHNQRHYPIRCSSVSTNMRPVQLLRNTQGRVETALGWLCGADH
jgi:hypothetical protein